MAESASLPPSCGQNFAVTAVPVTTGAASTAAADTAVKCAPPARLDASVPPPSVIQMHAGTGPHPLPPCERALWMLSVWPVWRPVMHYIDNQGALYSLINGRSKDHDSNRLVFVTLMRAAKLSCNVWFDYVPSAANIADLPTRLDDDAIMRLNRVARRVPLRLPEEWCFRV